MKPFRLLECVVTRDNRELTLYQRGGDFHIHVDGLDLMSSRSHGSEEEMARMALEALDGRPGPRFLVGGLGMGYTLRATLDALTERGGKAADVVVAEAFPAVVAWNRGPLEHLARRPLADPRVRVVVGDVGERIAEAADGPDRPGGAEAYDVILLDVDNGPEAFTLEENRRLYSERGLDRIHRALTPGGVLAVWSAHDHPPFLQRLRKAGFQARTRPLRARSCGKGERHVIFLAVQK
jgi:spermidine synthase